MKLRQRSLIFAGLTLLLAIVVAAGRAAIHAPLPAVLDLLVRVDAVSVAAPAPTASFYRTWDDSLGPIPPKPALVAPEPGVLLPNWEVGRNAVVLIPNHQAGMATVQLLQSSAPPAASP